MMAFDEKAAFSRRLSKALCSAGLKLVSPTSVAREFNKRYNGKPVTTQGVRKWLSGEAIPSQDKVRVLAEWLRVSAQWLRFGDEFPPAQPAGGLGLTSDEGRPCDAGLPEEFARLNSKHQEMVRELVRALLRLVEE
jgi:hypothetical protein